jgi:hypothetical protein
LELVGSSADDSHVVRYERLRQGDFFADFRRDKRLNPEVYHCIVQRTGDAQILAWTQHTSLDAAQAAAQAHLQQLNNSATPGSDASQTQARAAK